ncbi:hypothetical protein [Thermoanaerobacterium sp. RBIITD]|uniref:hypothetical protein n=1 Tax=Thermoanaerobacterium sp. RBIITD TaxID=1550240 RepID=UPI000BB6EA2D|nr:hypothetical protein [Thermoanaerobacterium sp. RBIITD]
MNKNIEIINENLWAVNFHHLRYIKDLPYTCNDPDSLDKVASLTDNGIIVLNKSHEIYPTLKQLFPRLMQNTDKELLMKIDYMQDKNRDGYDRVYKYCLNAVLKRRMVKKQFNEQSKEKPIFKQILNFIGFNSKERGGK